MAKNQIIAAETLRRILDERGVKHQDHYFYTLGVADGTWHMAMDNFDKTLVVDKLTPEQAIAATLGERTCNLVEDEIGLLHCSNCGGVAEKQSGAYWHYCPNCGKKVMN